MRVHGLDNRRNPVLGFRNFGWTIIGISLAVGVVTMVVVLTAGMAAGGAAVAGDGRQVT